MHVWNGRDQRTHTLAVGVAGAALDRLDITVCVDTNRDRVGPAVLQQRVFGPDFGDDGQRLIPFAFADESA